MARRNWLKSKEFICYLIIIVTVSGNRWGFFLLHFTTSVTETQKSPQCNQKSLSIWEFEQKCSIFQASALTCIFPPLLSCIKGEMDDFSMSFSEGVLTFHYFLLYSYEIISEILSCSKLGILEFQFF